MKIKIKNKQAVIALAFIQSEEVKAAKDIIKRETDCKALVIQALKYECDIDVSAVPENESIEINGSKEINRIGKDRIDITLLRAAFPDIAKKFQTRGIESHWKNI